MNNKILTLVLNPCIDKTITIDGFTYGGLNRIQNTRVDIGGKGINVIKVLAGKNPNLLACGIIAGKQGQDVINFLDEKNVDHAFIETTGETRTNYKLFDKAKGIITEINERGFFVEETILKQCIDNIISFLPKTEIMVLSGSLPAGVNDDIYKKIINISKNYDIKVILDADDKKLFHGVQAIPYAIKPNLYEFEQLTGKKFKSKDEIIAAARTYISSGISIVIISMGGEGALYINNKEEYWSKPLPIKVKSTVAAGDSMVAALAYGLKNAYSLEQIARFTTAAGSITASKEGSDVCSLDEVEKAASLVQLVK